MISLKVEGTEIGIEENALKDLVMAGMPEWIASHAEGDAKSRTLYLAFKGVALMMRSMIRREAAKKNVALPYDEEDDPIIGLAKLMLEGAMQFIADQQGEAIYEMMTDRDGVVITGIKMDHAEYVISKRKEALAE